MVVDDELATNLGLESLEQLRGLLKGQVEQELNGLTRTSTIHPGQTLRVA